MSLPLALQSAASAGVVLLALTLAGCRSRNDGVQRPAASTPELQVRVLPSGTGTDLLLIAAPGVRINARLKPALELPNGTVLRFDSPSVTPDSAYFTDAPAALLPGRHDAVHGTLRASVCPPAEQICRSVKLII